MTLLLIVLGAIALVLSFGKHVPVLYSLFFDYFPQFNKFRVPSMMLVLFQFAMAVLAAIGLDRLARAPAGPERVRMFRALRVIAAATRGRHRPARHLRGLRRPQERGGEAARRARPGDGPVRGAGGAVGGGDGGRGRAHGLAGRGRHAPDPRRRARSLVGAATRQALRFGDDRGRDDPGVRGSVARRGETRRLPFARRTRAGVRGHPRGAVPRKRRRSRFGSFP